MIFVNKGLGSRKCISHDFAELSPCLSYISAVIQAITIIVKTQMNPYKISVLTSKSTIFDIWTVTRQIAEMWKARKTSTFSPCSTTISNQVNKNVLKLSRNFSTIWEFSQTCKNLDTDRISFTETFDLKDTLFYCNRSCFVNSIFALLKI